MGPERLLKHKGTNDVRDAVVEAEWGVAESGRWEEQVSSGKLLASLGNQTAAANATADEASGDGGVGAWVQSALDSAAAALSWGGP